MSEPVLETQQTYDAITAEYARVNAPMDPEVLKDLGSLTAKLPPGSLVADVGCGPGHELRLLRQHGYRAVGLDLSIGQLRTGHLPGMVQADMRHLPLRRQSVDAIWCQAALLHIPHASVPPVLGEFARVTRTDGVLFLNVAEGDGEGWEVASNYRSTRRRWFTFHRARPLTELLATAGFRVYETRHITAGRGWMSLHCRRESDADTSGSVLSPGGVPRPRSAARG
jgi:SAM-dependent methyltransferase